MLIDRSEMSIVHWARGIMDKHGLIEDGWSFAINGRFSSALGRCTYTKRLIELCRSHVSEDSYENILDTLMHEIAHALVGPGKGHEKEWQQMAISLGARPSSHKSRDAQIVVDVPMYAIMQQKPDGTLKFIDMTSKGFYNQCMKGKKDIKTYQLKKDPASKGSLRVVSLPSSEVKKYMEERKKAGLSSDID